MDTTGGAAEEKDSHPPLFSGLFGEILTAALFASFLVLLCDTVRLVDSSPPIHSSQPRRRNSPSKARPPSD
jgi:hypothetical protein